MTIVVAYGKGFVIGKDRKLPDWKLPSDMENFKEVTLDDGNEPVVFMGRKTFESFPKKFRPLPGRINFILTRNLTYTPYPTNDKTFIVNSFDEVSTLYEERSECYGKKIFTLGGEEIYRQALSLTQKDGLYVNEIIATEVDGEFEGDTFFPAPDYSSWEWNKKVLKEVSKDEKNSHDFKIVRYSRSGHGN